MSCILDLTIIGDRYCPTTRTYLTYLKAHGFIPKRLLLVDFLWGARPACWGKIPFALFHRICKQRLHATRPVFNEDFFSLCDTVQRGNVPYPIDFRDDFDFSAHALSCTKLVADDFDDPALHKAMAKSATQSFLYTNGGRVPAAVLHRFPSLLHIHPGVVPYVRGSDGLFWSLLTRGKPGASCFYMSPGIDEGRLVHTKEFMPPDLSACANMLHDTNVLYSVLLTAYDPHLRAQILLEVLEAAKNQQGTKRALTLHDLPVTSQNLSQGQAYFAMHQDLLKRIFAGLIEGEST